MESGPTSFGAQAAAALAVAARAARQQAKAPPLRRVFLRQDIRAADQMFAKRSRAISKWSLLQRDAVQQGTELVARGAQLEWQHRAQTLQADPGLAILTRRTCSATPSLRRSVGRLGAQYKSRREQMTIKIWADLLRHPAGRLKVKKRITRPPTWPASAEDPPGRPAVSGRRSERIHAHAFAETYTACRPARSTARTSVAQRQRGEVYEVMSQIVLTSHLIGTTALRQPEDLDGIRRRAEGFPAAVDKALA